MTDWNRILPTFEMGSLIPKFIYQTAPTLDVPPAIQRNIDRLKAENPEWWHTLWTDVSIERFIGIIYGWRVLLAYQRIRPEYGPAKADLFRYLLMYRYGGVYLDLKSTLECPLDEVLTGDEMFVVSQWRNGPGETHANFGLHKELAHIPGGEFQQWHIIAAPGHPFLRRVIVRVLDAIESYRPWHGVGKQGVLKTTGPIPYTLALDPLDSPHKRIANESELGLIYSIEDNPTPERHYSTLDSFVADPPMWARPLGYAAIAAKRIRDSRRQVAV